MSCCAFLLKGLCAFYLPFPFIPISHVTVQFICHRNESTSKLQRQNGSYFHKFILLFPWLCGLVCPSHHEYCSTCVTEKVNFLMDAYFWDLFCASSFLLWGSFLVVYIQLISESPPLQSGLASTFNIFFVIVDIHWIQVFSSKTFSMFFFVHDFTDRVERENPQHNCFLDLLCNFAAF